ncbi:MAG: hypothetical protein ACLQVA_15580 [Candidatus Brocadiia bacterium]
MNRTRCATAGLAAALLAACTALCAPLTAQQGCVEAQNEARAKALQNLQNEVFTLKLGETKTVRDFIESTDLPKTDLVRGLLVGVVEFRPTRIYGDGECEVRLALSGDALRTNLKRILEQDYKKPDGEFAKQTFDGVGGKELEAAATSAVALPARSDVVVADGVPGWDRDASGLPIPARKRIETEHAADLAGLAKVKADVEKLEIGDNLTLGALMAANPLAKEAVEKFLAKMLPDRKRYWPKGIVEVRFALDPAALWTALEQANQHPADPTQRMPSVVLATGRDRTKNQTITSSGCAQLDGKPVNPADAVETAVPLELYPPAEPALPGPEQAK